MSLVNKFCFCGRLETGGIVVGILGIIGNIFIIKVQVVLVTIIAHIYGSESEYDATTLEDTEDLEDIQTTLMVAMVISGLLILSCIGNLIASILLIIGSKKRKPGFVFVWLIASIISIIMGFLTFFVKFNIISIISVCIEIYWWICIYALYQMLEREKLQPTQLKLSQRGTEMKYIPANEYPQTV